MIILLEFILTEPEVTFVVAILFKVELAGKPPESESAYPFVQASVESVGVARFIIFYEFNETKPVGAVIDYKGTVLA